MIVPTRFGLKYAPTPTLALEYEDDLNSGLDTTSKRFTSLDVYQDDNGVSSTEPTRKLHIVELPQLTRESETQQIIRQLQQDNDRFLSPSIVSETQLKRLVDRLVQNLPNAAAIETEAVELSAPEAVNSTTKVQIPLKLTSRSDDEQKLRQPVTSDMRDPDSVLENSNRNDSRTEDIEPQKLRTLDQADPRHFQPDKHEEQAVVVTSLTHKEKDEEEVAQDARKAQALRSELLEVSDEEVQSEELEYFSEDGSDEDSF